MAIGKIILGIFTFSIFLCVNALYNIGVASAKYLAVRTNTFLENTRDRKLHRQKIFNIYRNIGAIILISGVAYIVSCVRLFLGYDQTRYTKIIAISIALFTFVELFISIIGAYQTRKNKQPLIEAVKMTNFCSALISLVLTQTALLSFQEGNYSFYNGISGTVFGSITICIAIYMITYSYWKLSRKDEQFLFRKVEKMIHRTDPNAKVEFIRMIDDESVYTTLFLKIESTVIQDTAAYLKTLEKKLYRRKLVLIA